MKNVEIVARIVEMNWRDEASEADAFKFLESQHMECQPSRQQFQHLIALYDATRPVSDDFEIDYEEFVGMMMKN